jgi:hypothetical protein
MPAALYPSEELYPSEGLYPSDGPPRRRPRRKPPLELDVEVETAVGTLFRLPADSRKASNRPSGLSFSTQRGDGFGTGSLMLNRQIFKDYPDIGLMDTWRMVGRQGDVAYEGRLHSNPRTNDPQQQINVALVGWMTYLKGRPIAPLIIDRRLSGWGEPSVQRKGNLTAAGFMWAGSVASGSQDTGGLGPGVVITFSRLNSTYPPLGEAWFYASGEDIGDVRYDYRQLSSFAQPDSDWHDSVLTSVDDVASSYIAGTDHQHQNAVNQAVAGGAGFKYAALSAWRNANLTGDFNNQDAFLNLRIVGNHTLVARGEQPEEGYYVSDILQYILATYYPKIQWAGESNTFPLTQATWHDSPSDGYGIVQQLNNLVLWETNVWEDRKFYFEAADLTSYDWQIRTDEPGVTVLFQGDSIENFANGVVVVYTDFSGVQRTLYPPDHDELRDDSEDNPANRHGENLWPPPITVPWQCLEAEALQFGRAYLAEFNRPKRPGTFRVAGGYIKDFAGHWHQGWKVRNSETIGIMDHPADEPRLITATNWDQESLSLDITVDAPSSLLDAVVARQELALQARNLS